MLRRMCLDVEFNKEIPEGLFISPGGYEIVCGGKTVQFDFENTVTSINGKTIHVEAWDLDLVTFPKSKQLTLADLESGEFTEIFIYMGEEELDIIPERVKAATFEFTDNSLYFVASRLKEMSKALAC